VQLKQEHSRRGALVPLLAGHSGPARNLIALPYLDLTTQVYMIGDFAWYGHLVSHLLNAEYSPILNARGVSAQTGAPHIPFSSLLIGSTRLFTPWMWSGSRPS